MKESRHVAILQELDKNEVVSVKDLSDLLGVTDMTIRRDLMDLEEQGLLVRVHGGAHRKIKDSLTEETITVYYDDDGNEFKEDEVKEYENLNELIEDINYNINSLKEEILELKDNKNTEWLIKSKEKYIKEYQEILEKIKEEEE